MSIVNNNLLGDNFIDCTCNYKFNTNNLKSFILCTPARVGSSTWLYAFRKKYSNIEMHHSHDLNFLKNNLNHNDEKEKIIVYGIRNPIDHILSNMMVHHGWDGDSVRYNNKFNGKFLFDKKLLSNTPKEIIRIIKKNVKKYGYIVDWSVDFFNIIKYKLDLFFDKENGFQILRNNNITYIFYRMDKINSFKEQIKEITGLELGHDYSSVEHIKDQINNGNMQCNHDIRELYEYIKNTIKFDVNYLNSLVNNNIYKYFYTADERKHMIEKYNENK